MDAAVPVGAAGPHAPVLVLHGEEHATAAAELAAALRAAGHTVDTHALLPAARASDRAALPELDRALEGLAARTGGRPEDAAVVGLGRGGTLAFLYGCARRALAVVDVDGPVLHPALSPERPVQPLELALNLEGAFLGLFTVTGRLAEAGPVGAEERALLAERLRAAARPHALEVLPEPAEREVRRGAAESGYDAVPVPEVARRVVQFLAAIREEDIPPA